MMNFVLARPLALAAMLFEGGSTAPDYTGIATQVQGQVTGMASAAQPMILAALGAGLGIFAVFLLFKLGKRAISSATSSKG